MGFFLLLTAFLLLPTSLSADEKKSLFLKIYLPRIDVIGLNGVNISIIPSPIVKIPDRPGEVRIIGEDDDKTSKDYTKSGWEAAVKRKWLLLDLQEYLRYFSF